MGKIKRKRLKGKKKGRKIHVIFFLVAVFCYSVFLGICFCPSSVADTFDPFPYFITDAISSSEPVSEDTDESNNEPARLESLAGQARAGATDTTEETSNLDLEDIHSSMGNTEQRESQETSLTTDDKLEYIEEHPELYPAKLISFAKEYPQAISFVYNYLTKSQNDWGKSGDESLTQECLSDEVPTLYQWDERWGYNTYGAGYIGTSGCGPVCLSMVALYLTKNPDNTPSAIASYAEENGYYVEGAGTAWSLMDQGCAEFGITSCNIDVDEDELAHALADGHPIICSVKAGDFTNRGHFIVLASYDDGLFTVHDPNSPENTKKSWAYSELAWQIRKAWKFYEIE